MSCCRLGKPLVSCKLRLSHLAIGGCSDKAPVSVPSVPPSILPAPVRTPGAMASGEVAAAAILWPENATPSLFDPPPRV